MHADPRVLRPRPAPARLPSLTTCTIRTKALPDDSRAASLALLFSYLAHNAPSLSYLGLPHSDWRGNAAIEEQTRMRRGATPDDKVLSIWVFVEPLLREEVDGVSGASAFFDAVNRTANASSASLASSSSRKRRRGG